MADALLRRSWRCQFWHTVAAVLYWPRRAILWPLGNALDRADKTICKIYGWANNRAYSLEEYGDDIPF